MKPVLKILLALLFTTTVFAQSQTFSPFTGEYGVFYIADTSKTSTHLEGGYQKFSSYGVTTPMNEKFQLGITWYAQFRDIPQIFDSIEIQFEIHYVLNVEKMALYIQAQDTNGNWAMFLGKVIKKEDKKIVLEFASLLRTVDFLDFKNFYYFKLGIIMQTSTEVEVGVEMKLFSLIGKNADGGEIIYFKPVATTGLETEMNTIPESYSLQQNYPNPFNPSTKIKFSIPEQGMVSLIVYNLLGQEVARLVNEQLSAGTYEYNFDASNLSSGIYIYLLSTKNFIQTKKMLLVK